jgi:putative YhdH/YhfP family quinone oxidoreductase
MSVHKLTDTVKPEDGEILVTGASGGVGSVAVGIASRLGYSVVAASGKADAKVLLEKLGAKAVIGRNKFSEKSRWSLLKARWAGVIETVGGEILAHAIKSTRPRGMVTCCGNVASPELSITVYPFILRGVTLAGIDSQNCPLTLRREIWAKLASDWKFSMLGDISHEISLHALNDAIERILKGQLQGRTVINLDSEG